MNRSLTVYTDGACSGNPGRASIGVVILENGQVIKEISKAIGNATNNIAEYTALICALEACSALKAGEVHVFTDSELLYKQMIGQYKVRDEGIRSLSDQVRRLISRVGRVEIQHIPREKNKEADRLAKKALKDEQAKMVASTSNDGGEESPSSKG